MKEDLIHNKFLILLREKIPQNSKLANTLMEILCIEKEAVYRRLRSEVSFTLYEAGIIARTLGLSLDSVLGVEYNNSRPSQFVIIDYINPQKRDYEIGEKFIELIRDMNKESYGEMIESTNILPESIYLNFKGLTKFYRFKWKYQNDNSGHSELLSNIHIDEHLLKIQYQYLEEIKNLSKTVYVLDPLIFQYLVTDIKYFTSIDLVTQEDVQLLKNELFKLLDYIEELTINGVYPDTGRPVLFYISDLNFESNYKYFETPNHHLSLIKTFTLNSIVSQDDLIFEKMKYRMQSLRRVSTMISISGEKRRIQFFNEQRLLINNL